MYAVEFEAPVKDGVVHIPKDYRNLYENRKVRVFIMPIKKDKKDSFNPKDFFGAANISKDEIDSYLQSSKDEWDKSSEK